MLDKAKIVHKSYGNGFLCCEGNSKLKPFILRNDDNKLKKPYLAYLATKTVSPGHGLSVIIQSPYNLLSFVNLKKIVLKRRSALIMLECQEQGTSICVTKVIYSEPPPHPYYAHILQCHNIGGNCESCAKINRIYT